MPAICRLMQSEHRPQRDINRLRITITDKKITIDNDPRKTVASLNLKSGDELHWKDLGPQICMCSLLVTSLDLLVSV